MAPVWAVVSVEPLPLKGISRLGVSGSFVGMRRFAFFAPVDEGVNTTLTAQVSDGISVLPEHVSLWILKLEESAPVKDIVPTARFSAPWLVTVKICSHELFPTYTLPKLWKVGETATEAVEKLHEYSLERLLPARSLTPAVIIIV
jgi:hypothetical protein